VCLIYKLIRRLRRNGNRITIRWVSTSEDNHLLGLAKVQGSYQRGPHTIHTAPQNEINHYQYRTIPARHHRQKFAREGRQTR
jgi:hypothetical protein